MKDARNDFLNELKTVLSEIDCPQLIIFRILAILDKFEITHRTTELVISDNENLSIIKLYASAILIDGKARSTINHYVSELRKFSLYLEGKSFKDVSTFNIRTYLAKKKLSGLSNRTLDNIRSVLGAFYSWLTAEDYIPKNPCAAVKPIRYARKQRLPFSTVELDKLRLACGNQKERALVEFLTASGVRVSELCDLDVEDVDLESGSVHVRHGKGNKERYTYINDLAKDYLQTYLNDRTSGPLFLTQLKDRYTKGGVRFALHAIGDRAGVDDVHPHRFRRTFATHLASRGMQITEIQKLMGHTNINTTMIYVSVSDKETKYAYNKYS